MCLDLAVAVDGVSHLTKVALIKSGSIHVIFLIITNSNFLDLSRIVNNVVVFFVSCFTNLRLTRSWVPGLAVGDLDYLVLAYVTSSGVNRCPLIAFKSA